jgi:hypothetical protein
MYKWYERTVVCYACPADVTKLVESCTTDNTRFDFVKLELKEARWFTYG